MKRFKLNYAGESISIMDAILADQLRVHNTCHPCVEAEALLWEKWRLCYESGDQFIERYLQTYSKREDSDDFAKRKSVTYVPAFAKSAINDVKDSIFQRIADVTRKGGPQSYLDCVEGKSGGIDREGSTMNSFIGKSILPELLVMKKVGVFVDMPDNVGNTLLDSYNKHPYIYRYRAEDIRNWVCTRTESGVEYKVLLLRDYCDVVDPSTGLPTKTEERYRLLWLDAGVVLTHYFNCNGKPITRDGYEGLDPIVLNLPKIPFVLFEVSDSLMKDIANYQIALLNLASSDMSYVLKSNFPFYVEQFDPRSENLFLRKPSGGPSSETPIVGPGEELDAKAAKNQEIKVGASTGRRIPKGLEMPSFIHPSSEPLDASMKKAEELKNDIRLLLNLTLTNLSPKMASAESKSADQQGLEAGLSAIGLELECGERKIAEFWSLYLKSSVYPTVKYPQKYRLQSDEDKRKEANDILTSAKAVPSLTYKKEALKQVADTLLGTKISLETLDKINKEIDEAQVIVSDPDELSKDIEQGIVSLETASKAKNYPAGEVEKAKEDHAERLQRIMESQAQARGVPDLGGLGNASKNEKQSTDTHSDPTTADAQTRGTGK